MSSSDSEEEQLFAADRSFAEVGALPNPLSLLPRMSASTFAGGHGTKIVTCSGDNTLQALQYLKTFKGTVEKITASSGKALPIAAILATLGEGFPESSQTLRWLDSMAKTNDGLDDHLPDFPRLQGLYSAEAMLWAYSIPEADFEDEDDRQEEFARRITFLLKVLHAEDIAAEPLRLLQAYVIPARANWYDDNMEDRPVVKGIDDNGNPTASVQLEPLKQAKLDKYDASTMDSVAQASRFKFNQDNYDATAAALERELLDIGLDTEFRDCNRALAHDRVDRLQSTRYPSPLEFIVRLFRAQFCVPRQPDADKFQDLRIDKGSTVASFIAKHRSMHDLIKLAPAIAPTPQAVYQRYLVAIQDHDQDAFNHLISWAQINLVDERSQTVDRLYEPTQRYFDEMAKHKAHKTSSRRTFSSSRATTSPPPPSNRRSNTSRPEVYTTEIYTSRSTDNEPCDKCGLAHQGTCYIYHPNHAPRDFRPPRTGVAATVYRLRCQTLGLDPDTRRPTKSSAGYPSRTTTSAPSTAAKTYSSQTTTNGRTGNTRQDYRRNSSSSSRPSLPAMAASGRWAQASGDELDDVDKSCLMADLESLADDQAVLATTRAQQRAASSPRGVPLPAPTRPAIPAPMAEPAPSQRTPAAAAQAPAPSSAPAQAPAVQRRPAPVPFAPTAVPRNVPPSQLPDATRTARQRLADYQPIHSVAATPAAAPGFSMSLLQVLSMGPQLLEDTIVHLSTLLQHTQGAAPVPIQLSSLSIDLMQLPEEPRRRLLSSFLQQPPAVTAAAAPTASSAAALAAVLPPVTAHAETLAPLASAPVLAAQATSVPVQKAADPASTVMLDIQPASPPAWLADPEPFGCTPPEWPEPQQHVHSNAGSPPLLSLSTAGDPDSHIVADASIAAAAMPDVQAHPTVPQPTWNVPRPCIFALSKNPSCSAILVDADTDQPCLPKDHPGLHTIVDTGSTMNIITLSAAKQANLKWDSSTAQSMTTSSGSTACTLGLVTSPVMISLCHDDEAVRTGIMLDLHIVDSRSNCYDLLLGTQWLTAIGARLDVAQPSTLTYYPDHPGTGQRGRGVKIPLITTVQH